ncbi:MAG TPA: NUDIX domain-containing protein [Gemmatimonadaceae bacterium]|nr:NUDIX domain-containing protein [Gemmatimonadaceae bacterium]
MPARSPASRPRAAARRTVLSVDVVILTPRDDRLAVLLLHAAAPHGRERRALPWDGVRGAETLDQAAARVARSALGRAVGALEQVAAFGDRRSHPSGADVSVAYVALAAPDVGHGLAAARGEPDWFALDALPPVAARQRAMIDAAVRAVRMRLDHEPIAFRLLPSTFTLSELQETYELLLERRLHKASFRRALQAARLVEPTEEWRSEGRGRPAQLFRYAPRKRRGGRHGVRFDRMGG